MMDKDQTLYELNINRDLNYDIPQTPETITSRSRKAIPDRFKGKVAIVTGGTSGIGFSIVEELLKEGCAVAFSGRNEKTAIEAEEILEAEAAEVALPAAAVVSTLPGGIPAVLLALLAVLMGEGADPALLLALFYLAMFDEPSDPK